MYIRYRIYCVHRTDGQRGKIGARERKTERKRRCSSDKNHREKPKKKTARVRFINNNNWPKSDVTRAVGIKTEETAAVAER